MNTITKTTSAQPEWLDKVAEFAGRHPEIGDVVRRELAVRALLSEHEYEFATTFHTLSINLGEGGWCETLCDLVVAARRDFIPVRVDWSGSYLWAELGFGGGTVSVWDYHTTSASRGAVESLATCPIEDLDALLARCVEVREWGL